MKMKKLVTIGLFACLSGMFLIGCSNEVDTQQIKEFSYTNQWGDVMHCITVDANTHFAMMGCVKADVQPTAPVQR
jgi:hypothetical protein